MNLHLSSETLDLLLLSALPAAEMKDVHSHLEACTPCKALHDQLQKDQAHFQSRVFARTLPNIYERLNPPSVWDRVKARWRLAVPAAALAAAAMVAVFIIPQPVPYEGVKGGASFEVFTQREGSAHRVHADSFLREGDRIRFVVDSAGARNLLIASFDGSGAFTVYFPYGASQSGEAPRVRQELPGSIELDAVLGQERLYAVFSDTPVQSSVVREAVEKGEPLERVAGVRSVVVREFQKEAP